MTLRKWNIIRLLGLLLASVLLLYPRLFFLNEQGTVLLQKAPLLDHLDLMCQWDCYYYIDQANLFPPYIGAFFPLYSLVFKGFSLLLRSWSPVQVTILLSNVFSVIANLIVLNLGEVLWPRTENERT